MRKILFLVCALLTSIGTWADVTVTVHNQGTQGYTTYGGLTTTTISNDTYTTNAASGVAGLKLTNSALAWNRAGQSTYYLLQGVYGSSDETTNVTTITAPEGYLITGYSMEACGWNSNRTFTATAADGTTSITVNSTTTKTLSVNNLKSKSTTITVVGASTSNTTNNWFSIKNFTVTLAKIDFVSLTFDRSGTTISDVTVNVKDADGDAIPDVTASLEAINFAAFKTGSASVLSNTTNSVLAPATYTNQQGSTIEYTFKVEGLPTTFTYNRAALDVYQMNGGGTTQDAGTVREWTLAVETGDAANNMTAFVSQENADICSATEVNGGLKHKLWDMSGVDKVATDALYIKVTLTRTDQYGCYAGISEVQLYKPGATVQYVISDANGVVFTSDALNTTEGTVINELPSAYKKAYCTYNVTGKTMVAGANTVPVTVTYDMPFVASTDYDNAKWYYMSLRSKWLSYADNTPYTGADTKVLNDANYEWAFIGNPYSGIKIINKAAGAGKYLSYDSPANNTYLSMKDTQKAWVLDKNNSGFVFRMPEDNSIYMHLRTPNLSTCSMAEWSAVHNDAGSTIAIEEVVDNYYSLVESEVVPFLMDGNGDPSPTIGKLFGLSTTAATNIVVNYATQLNNQQFTQSEYTEIIAAKDAGIIYPEDGKYYVIKSVNNNKYINVKSASGIYADVDAPIVGSITKAVIRNGHTYFATQEKEFGWCYTASYPALLDAAGSGKYAHFSINTPGQVAFAHCLGNGEGSTYATYLPSSYYTVGTNNQIVGGVATAAAAQWTFEEVNTFNLTLHEGDTGEYWATFNAPFGAVLPDGTKAYVGTVTDNTIELHDIGQNIPANTPVVLKGSSENITATINDAVTNTLIGSYSNSLTGKNLAQDAQSDNLLSLGKRSDGTVGFYVYNGIIGANKAYIDVSSNPSNGFAFVFADDDVTGISNAQSSTLEGQYYDLFGRKVDAPAKGGLYIKNGKVVKM